MNAVVRLTHGNEVVLQHSEAVHVAQPAPLHALNEAVHLPGAPDEFVIAEEHPRRLRVAHSGLSQELVPRLCVGQDSFFMNIPVTVHPAQLQDAAPASLVQLGNVFRACGHNQEGKFVLHADAGELSKRVDHTFGLHERDGPRICQCPFKERKK